MNFMCMYGAPLNSQQALDSQQFRIAAFLRCYHQVLVCEFEPPFWTTSQTLLGGLVVLGEE